MSKSIYEDKQIQTWIATHYILVIIYIYGGDINFNTSVSRDR